MPIQAAYRFFVASTLTLSIFSTPAISQESQAKPFANMSLPALFNKKIQAELELAENQKGQLEGLLEGLQKQRNQLAKELKAFQQSGVDQAKIEARRIEWVNELETEKQIVLMKAMDVLLPHQNKRLEQATVQYMMRETAKKKNLPTGILAPEIRKYLDIDDSQAAKIKERSFQIKAELMKKIKKLSEQAQAQLLNELSKDQKSKLDELIGKRID